MTGNCATYTAAAKDMEVEMQQSWIIETNASEKKLCKRSRLKLLRC